MVASSSTTGSAGDKGDRRKFSSTSNAFFLAPFLVYCDTLVLQIEMFAHFFTLNFFTFQVAAIEAHVKKLAASHQTMAAELEKAKTGLTKAGQEKKANLQDMLQPNLPVEPVAQGGSGSSKGTNKNVEKLTSKLNLATEQIRELLSGNKTLERTIQGLQKEVEATSNRMDEVEKAQRDKNLKNLESQPDKKQVKKAKETKEKEDNIDVDKLEEKLEKLKEHLEHQVEFQVQLVNDELLEKIIALDERIEKGEGEDDTDNNAVKGNEEVLEQLSSLTEEFQNFKESFARIENGKKDGMDNLKLEKDDQKMSNYDEKLGSVDTRLDAVDTRLQSVDTKIQDAMKNFGAVVTRVDEMDAAEKERMKSLAKGKKGANIDSEQVVQLAQNVLKYDKKLDSVNDKVNDAVFSLEAVMKLLEESRNKMAALEEKTNVDSNDASSQVIDELQTQLKSQEDKLKSQEDKSTKSVALLTEKIAGLSESVAKIQEGGVSSGEPTVADAADAQSLGSAMLPCCQGLSLRP